MPPDPTVSRADGCTGVRTVRARALMGPQTSPQMPHKREKAPHRDSEESGAGLSPQFVRRRPTLPQGPPCSTIGAERLSFRVRNVTGRFPNAMTTETL